MITVTPEAIRSPIDQSSDAAKKLIAAGIIFSRRVYLHDYVVVLTKGKRLMHFGCRGYFTADVTPDFRFVATAIQHLMVKRCCPTAHRAADRFHVQQPATEEVQEIRIKHRWQF